jgi:hypothetical protein
MRDLKFSSKKKDYEYEKELREFKKAQKEKRNNRKGKKDQWNTKEGGDE